MCTIAHILVVDDEPGIRLTVRTALEGAGHFVDEASDGREALERIQRDKYDIMVLDLSMPVMDGMAVLKSISENPRADQPSIIVLTAYGSIPAAVRATVLGASDFIEKPSTPDEIRNSVAQVLSSALARKRQVSTPTPSGEGYEAVIRHIREAMQAGEWEAAESLLMRAADLSLRDAVYFNLLGVLYEAKQEWPLARKFYRKAMAMTKDRDSPAEVNLRRLYELQTFGKSDIPVELGDRPSVLGRLR